MLYRVGDVALESVAHRIFRLSEGDPTVRRVHLEALTRWHVAGKLPLEDLPRTRADLELLERVRGKLAADKRDPVAMRHPAELSAVLAPFVERIEREGAASGKDEDRLEAIWMRRNSDVLLERDEAIVVSPKTQDAASYWGREPVGAPRPKTETCSAATPRADRSSSSPSPTGANSRSMRPTVNA
jgi:hypothetical protein